MSVKFKSLLLLKAGDTMLKCFGGGFIFAVRLFLRLALIHIGFGFFLFGELCISRRGFTLLVLSVQQIRLLCPSLLPGACSLSPSDGRLCLQQRVPKGFPARIKLQAQGDLLLGLLYRRLEALLSQEKL